MYVACLLQKTNEIYRLTDCFVSCSSGSYIKYISFLVCKGGTGGRGVLRARQGLFNVFLFLQCEKFGTPYTPFICFCWKTALSVEIYPINLTLKEESNVFATILRFRCFSSWRTLYAPQLTSRPGHSSSRGSSFHQILYYLKPKLNVMSSGTYGINNQTEN